MASLTPTNTGGTKLEKTATTSTGGSPVPLCVLPTKEETEKVEQLRKDIQPLIDAYDGQIHPEMFHDFKLLRYVRGHGKNAAAAVESHLKFRKEKDIDSVRAIFMAEEEKTGSLPWPYFLDEFQPLLNGCWDGVAPVVHHGISPFDNSVVTFTCAANYNFDRIIADQLEEMLIRLILFCDLYFDLLVHRLSVKHDIPIMRHDVVDASGFKLSHLGKKAINILKRIGANSQEYPEVTGKTTACNAGTAAVTVWSIIRHILPKNTQVKTSIHKDDYMVTLQSTGLEIVDLPRRIQGSCECDTCVFHVDRSKHVVTIPKRAVHQSRYLKCHPEDELHWDVIGMQPKVERQIWFSNETEKDKVVFTASGDEMKGIYKCTEEGELTFVLSNENNRTAQTATLSVYMEHKFQEDLKQESSDVLTAVTA